MKRVFCAFAYNLHQAYDEVNYQERREALEHSSDGRTDHEGFGIKEAV
jgi:hypothetical protein